MTKANVLNHDIPFEKYFEEISRIPRGSNNEMAISNYLVNFAKEHNLKYHQDEAYNVIIYKPASLGFENVPAVILQAHMDMVCEKEIGCKHDFFKDPLDLYLEGPENNILRARGTTLGADDGMGVAQELAILANNDSPHPALEYVFTVEEEIGMKGAAVLDYSRLTGRRMISLDSGQEENPIVASCGGICIDMKKRTKRVPLQGEVAGFMVGGLISGHSGGVVNNDRGNALKLAGRVLGELLYGGINFNLLAISGGTLHNVVPKECEAMFACPKEQLGKVKEIVERLNQEIQEEYKASDKGVYVKLVSRKPFSEMISTADTKDIIALLNILPNDIYRKNMEHEGVVAASNCIAVIKTENDFVEINVSIRAQSESMMTELFHKMDFAIQMCGFVPTISSNYPCWVFAGRSPMWVRLDNLMQKMWGKALRSRLVHGGVECGYFYANIPGIDIVSVGPYCGEVHTTNEWLDLKSAHRIYLFLLTLLAEMQE